MSATLERVRSCLVSSEVRISRHGGAELRADGIALAEILASATTSMLVEDYVDAFKGPSILALHRLSDGRPVHVVWGFAKGTTTPAVLVTAYRPEPRRWSTDFLTRRSL